MPLPPTPLLGSPQPMIARIITFNTTQHGLLAAQPNWDTEVKVRLELPTDVSKEPITMQESRRNFALTARYSMEWTSYLSNARDSTELRLFLTRIYQLPIIVPLWPDMCELASGTVGGQTIISLVDIPARFGAIWIITTEDFSAWEIVTVSTLNMVNNTITVPTGVAGSYPVGCKAYPLIIGRLDEQPQPEAITDESMEVPFKIKESSNFAFRIFPATPNLQVVGGTIPEFQTAYLFNSIPNHSRPLDWTEMPDVVYEHIGFMREDQQRVYDHRTPRGQELEFYQNDRTSIAKIEWFWRAHRATTLRFMIPTFRGDLRMLFDTPGNTSTIRCEKSFFSNPARLAQPGDPYIALIDSIDNIVPFQMDAALDVSPTETDLRILYTNVPFFTAATTIVSHLLLARFQEPTLEWTYTTPYLGTTRIKFVELPHEYPREGMPHPPPILIEPAYLFIFNEVGVHTDYFTSYENTIFVDQYLREGTYKGTYVTAPFSFDTLKTNLKLDQEKLEFKSWKFNGNPLNKMWPFALDAILTLEIVEVDALHPLSSTAVSRFYGDVWSIDSDYKAVAVPFGNLFDRKFPRFLLSVSDNYTQFSPPTQLAASAFLVQTHLQAASYNGNPQIIVLFGVASDDYFSGGWLEIGTGVNLERRGILRSYTVSGILYLSIDRPLIKNLGFNTLINLYPGYDGSIDQCETKFNNRINFGGHPFIPNVNPGVKAMTPAKTQGGKKG